MSNFGFAMVQLILACPLLLVNSSPCSSAAEEPPNARAGADAAALPASLSGIKDKGVFFVYINEDRLATSTFEWQEDGRFQANTVLKMAGQSVNFQVQITPGKDGRWERITHETPRDTRTITRDGMIARSKLKDKTETVMLKPNTVLFDNFGIALLSQAIRMYDRAKGGKQTLSVHILPTTVKDCTLEIKDTLSRSIGGRDLSLTRYNFGIAGTDIVLWVDAANKLYLAEVPQQHAAYVREGYELLRQSQEKDPLLSTAKHTIKTDRGVGVPMRDGIKLSTDLYRPEGHGKFGVILIRTPYKKEMQEPQAAFYARRGYVVAVQDCRGRFGSPGVWEAFVNEKYDGHDAVEWLAAQPWSNGKVGMIGGSYVGWVQWWAASQRPPHLTTIIPNVSPPDPFYNLPYEYGVFFLQPAIWWAEVVESDATGDLSGKSFGKIMERKYQKALRALPVIDLDKTILGKENRSWRRWIEHDTNDAYWEQANFLEYLKDVNLPVFHQSGWFDGDGIGAKLNYLRMASHGHAYQKLVLGPWGHTDQAQRIYNDRDFGATALMDMQRAYLRWFDYWLKGIDNGINREPLVSLFVMGSNQWVHGPTYPLPQSRMTKWYLAGAGKANTSKGDGRLSPDEPAEDAPADHYTYDPGDPTPDPKSYEEPEDADPKKEKSAEEKKKAEDAYHETVTSARRDILVYQSEPLRKPLTFVGPLSAVLYAASSAQDTDWFVRLIEVDKAGRLFPLVEGKIRARFRKSMKTPELLEEGEVYPYQLDLWHTGITLPAGHRLRVEVASASFPTFSRNLNTGRHNEKETRYVSAEQTIHHSKKYPSHVLLPVIDLPSGGRK
jgi:putative CocE/NonD family hydrolase